MQVSNEGEDKWRKAQLAAAEDLVNRGGQALRQGQTNAGGGSLREAEAILEMVESPSGELLKLQARVFNELGVVHQRQNQLEPSRDYHQRAAEICDQLIAEGDKFQANGAATNLNLSSIYLAMDQVEEARRVGEKALKLIEEIDTTAQGEGGRPDPLALGALQNLAVIYARQSDWERANQVMEQAREQVNHLVEAGQQNFLAQLAQGCQQLSVMLFEAERFEEALRWGREAEQLSEKAYTALGEPVLPVYIISQINLISYYEKLGRFAEAEDCLWNALEVAGDDARILHRGVVFYETCRKQADARLEKGNLPREEVDSGYEELMERVEGAGGMAKVQEAARRSSRPRR